MHMRFVLYHSWAIGQNPNGKWVIKWHDSYGTAFTGLSLFDTEKEAREEANYIWSKANDKSNKYDPIYPGDAMTEALSGSDFDYIDIDSANLLHIGYKTFDEKWEEGIKSFIGS